VGQSDIGNSPYKRKFARKMLGTGVKGMARRAIQRHSVACIEAVERGVIQQALRYARSYAMLRFDGQKRTARPHLPRMTNSSSARAWCLYKVYRYAWQVFPSHHIDGGHAARMHYQFILSRNVER